jgi:hypothetical protein
MVSIHLLEKAKHRRKIVSAKTAAARIELQPADRLVSTRKKTYFARHNAYISFEIHSAADQYDRLPALANKSRRLLCVVIVAIDVVAAHAAKAATSTIPIVL